MNKMSADFGMEERGSDFFDGEFVWDLQIHKRQNVSDVWGRVKAKEWYPEQYAPADYESHALRGMNEMNTIFNTEGYKIRPWRKHEKQFLDYLVANNLDTSKQEFIDLFSKQQDEAFEVGLSIGSVYPLDN